MKLVLFILICTVISLVFLAIAFSSANKRIKAELKEMEDDLEIKKKQAEIYVKEKKGNEELLQKMHSDNNLDSANASLDLLQKLSEKGKQRNSK